MAADVLYDDDQVVALARECKRILFQEEIEAVDEEARGERVVLVADPRRERGVGCRAAFVNELKALGAEVAVEDLTEQQEQRGEDGEVWGGEKEAVVLVRAVWQ